MTKGFKGLWQSLGASAWQRFCATLAASLLASCVAVAAVVSMHPPSGGGELRIPVLLYGDGEESVSGLQFDFDYDPAQFELVGVTAGDVATDAGKEVILSEIVAGEGRILITGFNNNGMTDGQVATMTLRPRGDSVLQHDINLVHVQASDPDGNSVPIAYADLFQYPPAPPVEAEVIPDEEVEASGENVSPVDTEKEESVEAPDAAPPEEGDQGKSTRGGGFGGAGIGTAGLDGNASGDTSSNTAESPRTDEPRYRPRGNARSEFVPRSGISPQSLNDRGQALSNSSASSNSNAGRPSSSPVAIKSTAPATDGLPALDGNESSPLGDSSSFALARRSSTALGLGGASSASYTLALDKEESQATLSPARHGAIALAVALALALLALCHLVIGRATLPQRRRPR